MSPVDLNASSLCFPEHSVQLCSLISAGLLSIWQLQALMTKARMYAFHAPADDTGETFLEYNTLTSDRYTFMASVKTSVARSYYSMPDMPQLPALRASVCLSYIGTSSLSTSATLNCADSGEVYVRNINQVVSVDKSTRKPMPLPDWWRTKYTSSVVGNERLVIPRFTQPETVHRYECRVPWTDVDIYQHTNYVAYIRYCIDCAMDGFYNGAYSNFSDTLSRYMIKDTSIAFYNESNANNILQVSSWQGKDNPHILRFDGSKDETTVFQSSIEFYQEKASL